MLISANQFLAERPARKKLDAKKKENERVTRERYLQQLNESGFDNVGRAPVRGGCH